MGPHVLILLFFLAFGACAPSPEATEPHTQIPCSGCHAGALAEHSSASVPDGSCMLSGCHPDGGPELIRLDAVAFQHRNHGSLSRFGTPGCAACHEHVGEQAGAQLGANLDACVLCHRDEVFVEGKRDCALCHGSSTHVDASAQGLRVAHGWQDGDSEDCVRCHYDVGSPTLKRDVARCAVCHDDPPATLESQMNQAIHRPHRGIACHRCHGEGDHGIRAMSSAVDLDCHQCHSGLHPDDEDIDSQLTPAECLDCHDAPHEDVQRMVLGVIDGEEFPHVSGMFVAGLSCHSCHVEEPTQHPATPSAISCTACHPPEYSRILGWWEQGIEQRQTAAEDYLHSAESSLVASSPDTAQVELGRAARLLRVVRNGGGHHNLELSDWIFHRSLRAVEDAYRLAGQRVPQPPDLGTTLSEDTCVSCHYNGFDGDQYVEMPVATHRKFLRVGH